MATKSRVTSGFEWDFECDFDSAYYTMKLVGVL